MKVVDKLRKYNPDLVYGGHWQAIPNSQAVFPAALLSRMVGAECLLIPLRVQFATR